MGEVTQVLSELQSLAPFDALFSHEETGNDPNFQRDKAVAAWCREHGVAWQEFAQFGVVRRLQSRNQWQERWEAHMSAPALPVPEMQFQSAPWQDQAWPDAAAVCGNAHNPVRRQRGVRLEAREMFAQRKRWLMEHFFRQLRLKHCVLLDASGKPEGGQWDFDRDNRKPWPGTPTEPADWRTTCLTLATTRTC